ncbi:hypothetical protein D0Y65_041528, partial [Glycine soja]
FLKVIPWKLRTTWINCLTLMKFLQFIVSLIYKDGIIRVDGLLNYGFIKLVSLSGIRFLDFLGRFLPKKDCICMVMGFCYFCS